MLGRTIAAAPLAQAGLDTLSERFPGARPETIRIDAALSIFAEPAQERATGEAEPTIGLER